MGRCSVLPWEEFRQLPAAARDSGEIFFCRATYDVLCGKIVPIDGTNRCNKGSLNSQEMPGSKTEVLHKVDGQSSKNIDTVTGRLPVWWRSVFGGRYLSDVWCTSDGKIYENLDGETCEELSKWSVARSDSVVVIDSDEQGLFRCKRGQIQLDTSLNSIVQVG